MINHILWGWRFGGKHNPFTCRIKCLNKPKSIRDDSSQKQIKVSPPSFLWVQPTFPSFPESNCLPLILVTAQGNCCLNQGYEANVLRSFCKALDFLGSMIIQLHTIMVYRGVPLTVMQIHLFLLLLCSIYNYNVQGAVCCIAGALSLYTSCVVTWLAPFFFF